MIIYSNPYNSQKNIGKAYNDFIRSLNVPDDTWIVLQDGDIMYLTPNWGSQIESVVATHGEKYHLYGCYTNRVGIEHHLIGGVFSNIHELRFHRIRAEEFEKRYYAKVHEINSTVAGFFMLFQVKTWKAVGGFDEGTLIADILFSEKILSRGGKTALIKGLYVYHSYRPEICSREMARATYQHLNP
jgi:GT2 family glycosyltransferase